MGYVLSFCKYPDEFLRHFIAQGITDDNHHFLLNRPNLAFIKILLPQILKTAIIRVSLICEPITDVSLKSEFMIFALAAYIGYCIGYFMIQVVFKTLLLIGMALFVMLKYSIGLDICQGLF